MVKTFLFIIVVVGSGCQSLPIAAPTDCSPPSLPARPPLSPPLPVSTPPAVVVEACVDDLQIVGAYCLALENILHGY